MATAPIALFVYNRPQHTRRTVEALQKNMLAEVSDLYVFADAAKGPDAESTVRDVRALIRQIRGFKSVTIVERSLNYGLARSIMEGVTLLSEKYGRVIVLEDDLSTSPHFLEYVNAALDLYESDERVMQIAGYMFAGPLNVDSDALFLPFISSWGWATWRRAWRHFDPLAAGYPLLRDNSALRLRFNLGGNYDYFRMLRSQQEGKIESWAVRWYLSVFLHEGLVLYPRKTLVHNSGFDGSGVNCAVSDFVQEELEGQFRVKSWPKVVTVSSSAEMVFGNMPKARISLSSLRNRLMRFWKWPWPFGRMVIRSRSED